LKHFVLPALLLVTGCNIRSNAETPAPPNAREQRAAARAAQPAPKAATVAPATIAQAPASAAPAPITAAPGKKRGDIEWGGSIQWKTLDEGLAEAKRTNRPVALLIYADWCPHCHELAPVFTRADVAALAEKLVMIRQDSDEAPDWAQEKYGGPKVGDYVPRLFFLRPDGTIREDLVSDNPRYPYFYTPDAVDRLKDSMRKAAEG
jgi:thiol-disulfide isomerase/thioredoxin